MKATLKIKKVGKFNVLSMEVNTPMVDIAPEYSFCKQFGLDHTRTQVELKLDGDFSQSAYEKLDSKFCGFEVVKFKIKTGETITTFKGLIEGRELEYFGMGNKPKMNLTIKVVGEMSIIDVTPEPKPEAHYPRIVSDGTSYGTKVFVGDNELLGVTGLEVHDIKCDEPVNATIKLTNVKLG